MSLQKEHDIKSALRFLENLREEITHSKDIKDLQDPNVLAKLQDTIRFFEKILST